MSKGNKKIASFLGENFPKCDYNIKKEGGSYTAKLSLATQQFHVIFNNKGEMVEKQFPISQQYLPFCIHKAIRDYHGKVEIISAMKIYNLSRGGFYQIELANTTNTFTSLFDLEGNLLNFKEIEG